MTMQKILLFILFSCLLSCVDHSVEQTISSSIIHIDEGRDTYTNFSEIVDTIIYIPLEYNEESIIGTVNQIIDIGEGYLILDSYNSKSLSYYGPEGKFITKFGSIGRGPGEYLSPAHMSFDYNTEIVSVYDEDQRKIVQYNWI